MDLKKLFLCTTFITGNLLIGQTNIKQEFAVKIDQDTFDPAMVLWYKQPAKIWEDALPVGNGRIGAMVYGRYGEEIIQFNEETYWSGGPYSTVVNGGYKKLPKIPIYYSIDRKSVV